VIRLGISGLPPEDGEEAAFLDRLAAGGFEAFEVSFTKGFPWKEKRCSAFGEAAAERGIDLSIHAPYFAVLTGDEPEAARQAGAALEHTLKLGRAMGARVVVAHPGFVKGRPHEELHRLVAANLEALEPKVRHLGVALGLEVGGHRGAFGTLGDIALIVEQFLFVRPVVDWAHLHAMSGGALTAPEAFAAVFAFLREHFPGWAIDPLHCHFSDNRFGPSGEIEHLPYGQGTLRVAPLVEAAVAAGMRLTLISESHEEASHQAVAAEVAAALAEARPAESEEGTRPLGSGRVALPGVLRVRPEGDGFLPVGVDRAPRLSNIDKPFFADGYTKGDLAQYYAAVAPLLLPHLEGRAIVLARFPDGADGPSFYEKQAPSHRPAWLPTVPLYSEHRGEAIDYVTAPDTAALLWLANLGCIEIHPWLSRAVTPDRPDFAVFDLDPAEGVGWEQVAAVARLVEVALGRLGLAGHPKTSGASGLHVYVRLEPEYPYARVRRFVEAVGRLIVAAAPDLATMEWDMSRRVGRVFIDHNQNVAGKTIASVYSVRPRPGAPVSTPLLWEEVEDADPGALNIATIWERVNRFGDLFAPVLRGGQRLEAVERALGLETVAG
jgi:bifunctional non-homologous end joining protein LigD